jgi:hypothetical protein
MAVQAQRLHARPCDLHLPHRDAEEHHVIGVIGGSRLHQGRRGLAVAVRDEDEPGAAPDLRRRVDSQTRPVVPQVTAVEHDRHTGRPQYHPGIGVVRLSSSIHRDI